MDGNVTKMASSSKKVFYLTGDGSMKLSVEIPFAPDKVTVMCLSAYDAGTSTSTAKQDVVCIALFDLRTFSKYCGYITTVQSGSCKIGRQTYESAASKVSYENGVLTVTSPEAYASYFSESSVYKVEAIIQRQSDKELLEAEFAVMPDSGSVTFTASRINEAVTADEWDALIAQKPNVTFNLI